MAGLLVFESFSKRRTPGVCGAMSKMFVGGCWYFLEKCWKTGGKRTRCPRQPIVDMDVDCRRPRHDENYSSLFVENSHPETLHRDMCIACSGSSWILPMYSTNSQVTLTQFAAIARLCYIIDKEGQPPTRWVDLQIWKKLHPFTGQSLGVDFLFIQ